MRLGIDLGTTRTLVAAVDRGNYPVVTFENARGEFQEWYPSLVAVRGNDRLFGFDALEAVQDPEFISLLNQQTLAHDPARGEDLQAIVANMYRMPARVVDRARGLLPAF